MQQKSLQRTALFIASISAFMSPLMLSAVNVAVPAIAEEFAATAVVINWIPLSYLLSSAVFMLPAGRIADAYGRKRVYLTGMIVITIASPLAAAADSMAWLLVCRVLQGLGAAMLFATGSAILTAVFPPDKRGSVLGISVSAVYLGLTCGPMLGGWVITEFGWRASFLMHLPLAVVVIIMTATLLTAEWKEEQPKKFDLNGSLIYGCSIVAVMCGLSMVTRLPGLALIIFGCLGLMLFFRHAGRCDAPVFDVSLFRNNPMFTFSCLASLVVYSAAFGSTYLMSLYLQNIKDLTPQAAGIIMIGQPLIMALLSPLAGKLSGHYEPRILASLGVALMSIGLALLSNLSAQSAISTVFSCLMLTGLGFALFSSPNVNAIMSSVGKNSLGIAASSVSTMRVLGQMTSMAVVTLVFALLAGPVEVTSLNENVLMYSINMSFAAAAGLAALAIPLSLRRGNMRG
ncbi:MAG: MFS transporter [Gammaproteobacteria bacterium]